MTNFVQNYLSLKREDAAALQRQYYFDHGTTLNGLMIHHNVSPKDFLDYVHDIDHSVLSKNIPLREQLEKLSGKKYIFTNGTVKHAEDTLDALGLADLFDDMFDIIGTDYVPKPDAVAFDRFFVHTGLNPKNACMFEDLHHNLKVPHERGMKTILITDLSHPNASSDHNVMSQNHPYVDFVTSDLVEFLKPLGE